VKQDKFINKTDYVGIRYIIKNEDFGKLEANLTYDFNTRFNCENNKESFEKIEQELCNKIYIYEDVDELVDSALSCITAACVIWHSMYQEGRSM
jgi:hypothetical protein